MIPPVVVTFTGADTVDDLRGMASLSARYPIEWGILASRSRSGLRPRYPSRETIAAFALEGLNLSLHVCGGYAREILTGASPALPGNLAWFSRVQVNAADPVPARIEAYLRPAGIPGIAQWRGVGAWPGGAAVEWLFDASGGRGVAPTAWPKHPGWWVGYAGGLGPANVAAAAEAITADAPPRGAVYWLDMESGVRTDDRLDLAKCRAVCEALYGR